MIFRELGEAKFWPAGSAQGLCSGRTDGQNLSFPASFFGSFFGRAKNEQRNLGLVKEPSRTKRHGLQIRASNCELGEAK